MKNQPESLLAKLLRVSRMANTAYNRKLMQQDLSVGQPAILEYLNQNDGAIQVEIGRALDLQPASIFVNLRGMERDRLIFKQPDQYDLRVNRVYLTQRGKDVIKQMRKTAQQTDEAVFLGMTPQERETFEGLLERVGENLSKDYHKGNKV